MNPRTAEALAALDPADRAEAVAIIDAFSRDVADLVLRLVLHWIKRSRSGPVSPGALEALRILVDFLRGAP